MYLDIVERVKEEKLNVTEKCVESNLQKEHFFSSLAILLFGLCSICAYHFLNITQHS